MKHVLIATLIALTLPIAAIAQEAEKPTTETPAAPTTLFAGSIDLPILEGSSVPDDCQFPTSLSASPRFELACVVMPRNFNSSRIAAAYVAALGERGWRQDSFITGGVSAVRVDADNCRQVLGIYPETFPPNTTTATNAVLWFALDRERQCEAQPASAPTPG